MKIRCVWISDSNTTATPYDSKLHRWEADQFFFFMGDDEEDALLLVGNGDYPKGSSHYGLIECALNFHVRIPRRYGYGPLDVKAKGAGNCSGGKIVRWESEGFGVITPMEWRPMIKEALEMDEGENGA